MREGVGAGAQPREIQRERAWKDGGVWTQGEGRVERRGGQRTGLGCGGLNGRTRLLPRPATVGLGLSAGIWRGVRATRTRDDAGPLSVVHFHGGWRAGCVLVGASRACGDVTHGGDDGGTAAVVVVVVPSQRRRRGHALHDAFRRHPAGGWGWARRCRDEGDGPDMGLVGDTVVASWSSLGAGAVPPRP